MKKTFKNVLKVTLVLFLSATISSCAKQNVEAPQEVKLETAEILNLKAYMAQLVAVKPEDITYDEDRQMFAMFGYDQISLKSLNESFQQSKTK